MIEALLERYPTATLSTLRDVWAYRLWRSQWRSR